MAKTGNRFPIEQEKILDILPDEGKDALECMSCLIANMILSIGVPRETVFAEISEFIDMYDNREGRAIG